MKRLTPEEIKFVKETKFTPTVYQCDQYYLTSFDDYTDAAKVAKEKYGVDLDKFIAKNIAASLNDADAISLDYVAIYLLYSFFTKDELEKMTPKEALSWLMEYRYYFGFRKWAEQDAANAIYDAIAIYDGAAEFYDQPDGNVWCREK